jgi:hypothetical protein
MLPLVAARNRDREFVLKLNPGASDQHKAGSHASVPDKT